MNVLFLSPGFPVEMPLFVAGLAEVGARVIGLGEQPEAALPARAARCLGRYVQVPSLWDEQGLLAAAREILEVWGLDRVECLWEPGVLPAARLREALGLPGMSAEQAVKFRDKERMKAALDAAGIRTPRHRSAQTEPECRAAAEELGYPLVLKPVSGAGSADTHRVDGPTDLERVLPRVRHVSEVSVEEFIQGEEYTFDTICTQGRILFHSVSWYRPRPLIGRSVEWISPQTVCLRRPDVEALRPGLEMGRAVLRALGPHSGFTHMEWFLTDSGEAVFGEIAARPPGALSVDLMNFASDIDTYTGWAEAVCDGRFSQPVERRYNAAVVFKRAQGVGRIARIEGLERLVSRYGPHIVAIDLLPVGAPRRDWKQTLLSDGHLIVRHGDLQATLDMADRVGTDLRLLAG